MSEGKKSSVLQSFSLAAGRSGITTLERRPALRATHLLLKAMIAVMENLHPLHIWCVELYDYASVTRQLWNEKVCLLKHPPQQEIGGSPLHVDIRPLDSDRHFWVKYHTCLSFSVTKAATRRNGGWWRMITPATFFENQ